jgi:hypothetical protein
VAEVLGVALPHVRASWAVVARRFPDRARATGSMEPFPAPTESSATSTGGRRPTATHPGSGRLWAFSALTRSEGARHRYDVLRARGQTHHQALRALANRLVGILHGCLTNRQAYSEHLAWSARVEVAA